MIAPDKTTRAALIEYMEPDSNRRSSASQLAGLLTSDNSKAVGRGSSRANENCESGSAPARYNRRMDVSPDADELICEIRALRDQRRAKFDRDMAAIDAAYDRQCRRLVPIAHPFPLVAATFSRSCCRHPARRLKLWLRRAR
jgi:hypothetical protein